MNVFRLDIFILFGCGCVNLKSEESSENIKEIFASSITHNDRGGTFVTEFNPASGRVKTWMEVMITQVKSSSASKTA